MYLTISGYLIYNLYRLTDIENLIRYSVIAISILFDIFLAVKYLKMRRKPLKRKYFAFIFTILLLGAAQYFVSYTIDKGLSVVDNISVKKVKTYSTSLITLNTSTLSSVSDITGDTKIGRISDKKNIEGYVLTKEIIKKALKENKISLLGPVPPLTEEIIDETTAIVGQMGVEPFLKALDENGKEITLTGRGEMAKCFCHEIDHLNGILFVDKIDKKDPFKGKDQMREI